MREAWEEWLNGAENPVHCSRRPCATVPPVSTLLAMIAGHKEALHVLIADGDTVSPAERDDLPAFLTEVGGPVVH